MIVLRGFGEDETTKPGIWVDVNIIEIYSNLSASLVFSSAVSFQPKKIQTKKHPYMCNCQAIFTIWLSNVGMNSSLPFRRIRRRFVIFEVDCEKHHIDFEIFEVDLGNLLSTLKIRRTILKTHFDFRNFNSIFGISISILKISARFWNFDGWFRKIHFNFRKFDVHFEVSISILKIRLTILKILIGDFLFV